VNGPLARFQILRHLDTGALSAHGNLDVKEILSAPGSRYELAPDAATVNLQRGIETAARVPVREAETRLAQAWQVAPGQTYPPA
jgi:hypothetical protein